MPELAPLVSSLPLARIHQGVLVLASPACRETGVELCGCVRPATAPLCRAGGGESCWFLSNLCPIPNINRQLTARVVG